jgi:hypothetical protein
MWENMQTMNSVTDALPDQVAPRRLQGSQASVGLALFGLLLLICSAVFGFSLYAKYTIGTAPCDSIYHAEWADCAPWFDALDQLRLGAAGFETYFLILRIVASLPFFALALLLVRRRRDEVRVLLLAGFLLLLGIAGTWYVPFWGWGGWWLMTFAGQPFLNWAGNGLTFLLFTGAAIFALTFPDGRFVPRWLRWLAAAVTLLMFGEVFLPHTPLYWGNWPAPMNPLVPVGLILSVLYAILYRYRRVAGPIQRQQIKWVVIGFLLLAINYIVDFSVFELYPAITGDYPLEAGMQSVLWELGQDTLWYISQFAAGICIGFAILRRRLWDIDGLINRTLAYGALTVTLAAVYGLSVISLQQLLPADSPFVIVLSTLAIAALFNPLRLRIQNDIDRLFYRRKYDAQQTLAAFAATAREETDVDELTGELMRVVEDTMQPAHVSLWLRVEENQ